jgi:chromosomal replication initiation ATPase DnaA
LASQLPLPFPIAPALGRADFIEAPGNAEAVALIDAWPGWKHASALYGPSGSGKSHLVHAWTQASGAIVFEAGALSFEAVTLLPARQPVAVENVDSGGFDEAALFALFQCPSPLLLTGREPPASWGAALPDLKSRFAVLHAIPLWEPDDALLAALARKLFADRQLSVPDPVIARILRSVERSPAAVRDFVARADAHALAQKRPITAQLVGDLLGG